MTQTALILGGSGKFGRNAAEAFWNAGWQVRLHDRAAGDLMRDARGADVIVNGWNPPGYDRWARELPGMTRRVIDAAEASGATVILPGNVYTFGAGSPERLSETTPHAATNPLGRLRIDLEAAYRESGVQTIVLRCGDFLDTEPSGNWFDKILAAKAGRGRFVWPGDPDVPHAFAFLPDVAQAAVGLAERREHLARFEDVPFPGHTLTGRELAALCGQALGRDMKLVRFNWLAVQAARPFWKLARGLVEMRYLWSMPHRLDGEKFDALLPEFRETPVEMAVASALQFQVDPDQPVARGRALAAAQ